MLNVLSLFSGIGTDRKALRIANIPANFESVEIDKYAVKSYNAIHNDNIKPTSVVDYQPQRSTYDLLFHGSPCQGFSISGLQKGIEAHHSGLLLESIKIIGKTKPKVVIWENVKAVLSKKHNEAFQFYLDSLTELGYKTRYEVLNSQDYGIPQRRNRVFVVSTLNDEIFTFPKPIELKTNVFDYLETLGNEKIYTERTSGIFSNAVKPELKDIFKRNKALINQTLAPTIKTNGYKRVGDTTWLTVGDDFRNKNKNIIVKDFLTQNKYKNIAIRHINSLEAFKLMGFEKQDWQKAKEAGVSETQLFKQAGNAIVVNVLVAIFKELYKEVL